MGVFPDDQMIVDAHINSFCRFDNAFCHVNIRLGRGRVTAWVVVDQNQGTSPYL
jgi:hypothetical protein